MKRSDYQAFFKLIASQHTDIAHQQDGRFAFDMYDDPDELLPTQPFMLTWQTGFVLILEHYELKLTGNRSGGFKAFYPGAFMVLGLPTASRTVASIIDEAETVSREIWAKIAQDQKSLGGYLTIGGKLIVLDEAAGIQCNPVFGFEDGALGVRAEFIFTEQSSSCQEHNPGKWLI